MVTQEQSQTRVPASNINVDISTVIVKKLEYPDVTLAGSDHCCDNIVFLRVRRTSVKKKLVLTFYRVLWSFCDICSSPPKLRS